MGIEIAPDSCSCWTWLTDSGQGKYTTYMALFEVWPFSCKAVVKSLKGQGAEDDNKM